MHTHTQKHKMRIIRWMLLTYKHNNHMNIMHAGKIHLYLEILEVKLTGRGTETVHSEKTPKKQHL